MTITPDTLTDLASVKALLRLPAAGTAQDANLTTLVTQASAAIARWCRREWFLAANGANPVTEYLSGRGFTRLLLSHAPVQCPILTGSTTQGSATVTGLSSTSYLFPNQSVSGSALQAGSFVQSVDSATQVTLNQAAASTATGATLVFGAAVWVDDLAFWGSAPGAFAATAMLYEGADYAIARDGPGGSESRVAWLEKINGAWEGQFRRDRGQLSTHVGDGQGNVKITYTAGLQALPDDLKAAATQLVVCLRKADPGDATTRNDPKGDYAYEVLDRSPNPQVATIRGTLATYRRLRLG